MVRIKTMMAVLLLPGCMTVAEHKIAVQGDSADRVTAGTVQKEIKVGMSSADVASVLGSPNIVSTDKQRREVWIYDKVVTAVAHSKSRGGYSHKGAATSITQRTLPIIIKFDENGKVRDFSYRTSRF